jgi:hypothetical protein
VFRNTFFFKFRVSISLSRSVFRNTNTRENGCRDHAYSVVKFGSDYYYYFFLEILTLERMAAEITRTVWFSLGQIISRILTRTTEWLQR